MTERVAPPPIEFDPPFAVDEPNVHSIPFVFNTPHSGAVYPQRFLDASRLDALTLRRSEDAYVDQLFAPVVDLGAPLMRANFPRAYLDVNREPYELDPRMFADRLPPFSNTRSMRVAGGLGTVPRIVADGQEIYRERLAAEDALSRIELLYKPYHRMLRSLIHRTVKSFGTAVLIDCHSMPSSSLGPNDRAQIDIVLGDRFGTSSAPALVDGFEHCFRSRGLSVVRNKPYAGGFITEHYGEPNLARHALQIEINRALYMNERTLALTDGFGALVACLTQVMAMVAGDWPGWAPQQIAAE